MSEQSVQRRAVVWGLYPTLVFGGMAVTLFGLERQWMSPEWWGAAVVLVVALAIVALERLVPHSAGEVTMRTAGVDLLHNLLSSGGTSSLVRAALFGVLIAVGGWLSTTLGVALWPSSWPLVFQIALAAVLGEFGNYWAHRWMHGTWLWRIHALHHSPTHLYLLASGRSHPFNAMLTHVTQVAPAILLGGSPELIAGLAVFTAITGLLQHCNVEMRTAWLSWLIATPDLHRTHHSLEMEESNTNFGNNLVLWDMVFGTWKPGLIPKAYGVEGVHWPETYLGHLATPFTLDRLSEGASSPEHLEHLEASRVLGVDL